MDFIKFRVSYPATVDNKGEILDRVETYYKVNKTFIVAYCPSLEEGFTYVYVAGLSGHLKAVYSFEEFDKMMNMKSWTDENMYDAYTAAKLDTLDVILFNDWFKNYKKCADQK